MQSNIHSSDGQERAVVLTARSNLHAFISLMFADPASARFLLLCKRENIDRFMASFGLLEEVAGEGCEAKPLALAVEVISFIERKLAGIRDEWVRVFGHILSRDTSCYELEHRLNQDVFAATQSLADIQGFYRAFGLVPESGERADHISVESEFLAFLLLKQANSSEEGQSENEQVCAKAVEDFQKDHFLPWVHQLGRALASHPTANFYRIAGNFLITLVEYERFLASMPEV